MSSSAAELLAGVVPPDLVPSIVELAPYFVDSFGNATRIDYGTGHETTFCALLCCLAKLGVLKEIDLLVRARTTSALIIVPDVIGHLTFLAIVAAAIEPFPCAPM